MLKQRQKDEADRLVTKCFLWGDVPFNIAKNNPYYHAMFEAAGTVRPDYRGPVARVLALTCTNEYLLRTMDSLVAVQ